MAREFSEQDLASMEGPRAIKEPGSTEWCWQTISALQHMWSSLHLNYEHYMGILAEAEEQAVWEKIPPEAPYGSKENMLKQVEVGDTKDAQKRMKVQTLAAQARALQKNSGVRQEQGKDTQSDNGKTEKITGRNSSESLLRLIEQDHPEVMERIIAQEFDSVRAAAREAGITLAQPKKTVTLSDNVERVASVLKGHYEAEQIQQIIKKLSEDD